MLFMIILDLDKEPSESCGDQTCEQPTIAPNCFDLRQDAIHYRATCVVYSKVARLHCTTGMIAIYCR